MTIELPVLGSPLASVAGSAHAVEELHRQFRAKNERALLDAVDFCARAGMAMPPWLANAFCRRYMKWHQFEAKSLDEAFKVERPKRMQTKKAERREKLKLQVVLEVLRIQSEKRVPLDNTLFERVGEKLGIKRAHVAKMWGASPWRRYCRKLISRCYGNSSSRSYTDVVSCE